MSCIFRLQAVRRRAQVYVHIDLMGSRTHSSPGHSQPFEWNLFATRQVLSNFLLGVHSLDMLSTVVMSWQLLNRLLGLVIPM